MFHATATILDRLDKTQGRFLWEFGVSPQDALIHSHLAPLATRLGVVMAGVIHRTVLVAGPRHVRDAFQLSQPSAEREHNRQPQSHRDARHLKLLARPALCLVDVYNTLPPGIELRESAKAFQSEMQPMRRFRAGMCAGECDWPQTYSTR